MALFLSILKIVGLVLLGILLFALLLIFLLLFVPVRYKGRMHYEDEFSLDAKVTYLLHFVSVAFVYRDEFKMTVRILGIPLKIKKKDKNKDEEISEGDEEDSDKENKENKEVKTDELNGSEKDASPKGKSVKHTVVDYINLLMEDSTKAAWEVCKKRMGKLLKLILPKKLRINVTYGLDNPYNTSLIMAIYDVFYLYFNKTINVCPVYDQKVVKASGKFRGSIMLAPVLWHILIVVLDKDCRAFYKKVKKK